MTPRFRAWGHYLAIFLPLGAGVGGAVGAAVGYLAAWALAGSIAGVALSIWLALTTRREHSPLGRVQDKLLGRGRLWIVTVIPPS